LPPPTARACYAQITAYTSSMQISGALRRFI
jgi:hypothetical protein